MHFEVPKAKTLKEFSGEYVMIVVSIVTALALEHTVQTIHHRHLAHQASESIEREISDNISELSKVIDHNLAKEKELRTQSVFLLNGIRAKADEVKLMSDTVALSGGRLNLSIQSPTFQREAWEVAVANQAVSWMEPTIEARYAAAYASMRDIQALGNGYSNRFFDGVFMQDVASNIAMGTSNPREVYRLLNQMIAAYASTNGNLVILKRDMQRAKIGLEVTEK